MRVIKAMQMVYPNGPRLSPSRTEDISNAARGGCHVLRSVFLFCPGNRNGLKRNSVHYGMSRKQAEKVARKIGAVVTPARQSGETIFVFPNGQRMKTNARRKDTSMALVKALMNSNSEVTL